MNSESSFTSPFRSYGRLSSAQVEGALKESLIVLDTNVLLGLYRVTPTARAEMLKVIEAARERIWIPHQVALEFHQNRVGAAKDQMDSYAATSADIEGLREQTLQKINQFANRCALEKRIKDAMKSEIANAFRFVVGNIEKQRKEFDIRVPDVLERDPILEKLAQFLDGRVGEPFGKDQMVDVLKEAEVRRSEKIPPGYKDGGKSSNPFGDYILWEQTLREAEKRGVAILLVSNDEKEDWVEKKLNFSLGPRAELVEEVRYRVGKGLDIMTFPSFLEAAKSYFRTDVSIQTLDQARGALEREKRNAREKLTTVTISEETLELFERRMEGLLGSYRESDAQYDRKISELQASEADPILIESFNNKKIGSLHMYRIMQNQKKLFDRALSVGEVTAEGVRIEVPRRMAADILELQSE